MKELWQALISDRFFLFQEVKKKKWIIGSSKASQLSLIEVLMRRDLDELLSSLSGQIGWLTIQPFIHDPNEKGPLMTHRRKGGGLCKRMCVMVWDEEQMKMRIWRRWPIPFFFFFVVIFGLAWNQKTVKITFESTSPNPFLPELPFPASAVT